MPRGHRYLPTDRPAWSDADGKARSLIKLPSDWQWQVQRVPGQTDAEGASAPRPFPCGQRGGQGGRTRQISAIRAMALCS